MENNGIIFEGNQEWLLNKYQWNSVTLIVKIYSSYIENNKKIYRGKFRWWTVDWTKEERRVKKEYYDAPIEIYNDWVEAYTPGSVYLFHGQLEWKIRKKLNYKSPEINTGVVGLRLHLLKHGVMIMNSAKYYNKCYNTEIARLARFEAKKAIEEQI